MFNQTTPVTCCFNNLNCYPSSCVIFMFTHLERYSVYLQSRNVRVVFLMNKSNGSVVACKLDSCDGFGTMDSRFCRETAAIAHLSLVRFRRSYPCKYNRDSQTA